MEYWITGLKDCWFRKMKIELHMPNDLLDVTQEEVAAGNASLSQRWQTKLLARIIPITLSFLSIFVAILPTKTNISKFSAIGLFLLIIFIAAGFIGAFQKYLHFKLLIREVRNLRTNN
jgi:hypothetical protein